MNLRDQAAQRDRWLVERLATVLPAIMRREGIDAWVIAGREYNEDPVLATMLPATWMSARRRTILVFTDFGARRAAISRYDVGETISGIWDPDVQPDQWHRLADHLAETAPERIAVNTSADNAFADGMSAAELAALRQVLPANLADRLTSGDGLAVGWLETRSPGEMAAYPGICRTAHGLLGEALSARVVEPGTTTTADVEWWLRRRVAEDGFTAWFHPTVSVQRAGGSGRESFASAPGETVIVPGDLVHIDFGIVDRGLHTDQQQHAYVLRPGETAAPDGLAEALATGNRLQDLVLAEFAPGRSGNAVLEAARAAAIAEGIRPRIYSHPIGLHGHAAGPTIGLWDAQGGVPGAGDLTVHADTAYSIELAADVTVPEWDGETVSIMLEEEAFFDGVRIDWLDGRQTELHLI
jgi:Xaa-Pro aminopeptidase